MSLSAALEKEVVKGLVQIPLKEWVSDGEKFRTYFEGKESRVEICLSLAENDYSKVGVLHIEGKEVVGYDDIIKTLVQRLYWSV